MVHNSGYGRVGIMGIDRNVGNGGSVGFGNVGNGGNKGGSVDFGNIGNGGSKGGSVGNFSKGGSTGGSVGFESYLQFANLLSTMNLTCKKRHAYPHENT